MRCLALGTSKLQSDGPLACLELALRTRAPILVRLGFSLFGLGSLGALFLYVSLWDIKGLLGILSSPLG